MSVYVVIVHITLVCEMLVRGALVIQWHCTVSNLGSYRLCTETVQ